MTPILRGQQAAVVTDLQIQSGPADEPETSTLIPMFSKDQTSDE
jgi:hypothetical protein